MTPLGQGLAPSSKYTPCLSGSQAGAADSSVDETEMEEGQVEQVCKTAT